MELMALFLMMMMMMVIISDLIERGFESVIKHYTRRDADWVKGLEGE